MELPSEPGSYVLVMALGRERLLVGGLGEVAFPAGWYVYCGSALNGLAGRIRRHCRCEKKMHWHIDYLLRYATVVEVRWELGRARRECEWSAQTRRLEDARTIVKGFGSSDCGCVGHLAWLPRRPDLSGLAARGVRLATERVREEHA